VAYLEIDAPDPEAAAETKSEADGLRQRASKMLGSVPGVTAFRSVCCCCKRRAAAATVGLLQGAGGGARSITLAKPTDSPQGPLEVAPPSAGEDEGYALLQTPRRGPGDQAPSKVKHLSLSQVTQPEGAVRDDDFFDARSEVASECGSPRQATLVDICLADPTLRSGDRRSQVAKERLATLLAIESRCRGTEGGVEKSAADELAVEDILKEDSAQLWFCHSKTCPFVIGCLWCRIPDVSVEDAVRAIQSPDQRLSWDGDSFSTFEVLRTHDPADPTREDVVFTVIPIPRPIRDREILQRRWQVPLGDSDGGQALLMQSFEDSALKPVHPQRVRAFTHLSGYILRPVPGEPGKAGSQRRCLEIVVISQCDLGGSLPGWFQNLARRMAKRRCVAWGAKLREHCQRLSAAA